MEPAKTIDRIDTEFYDSDTDTTSDGIVSRTSGVTSLAIHFFAGYTLGDESVDRFHLLNRICAIKQNQAIID